MSLLMFWILTFCGPLHRFSIFAFFLGLALFFLICWPHPWTIVLDAHRSLFSPSLGWFVSFNWKRKMNKSGGITKWINKQINENKNKQINQWNVYGHTRDNTTYKQLVLPRSFGTIVTLKLFSVSMVNTLARWHLKFTSISKLTGLIELSLHHTPTHPEPFHLPSSFGLACVAWRFCWVGRRSGVAAKFARDARENERRSREKNKNQVASAPISSRFLCPRPTCPPDFIGNLSTRR